MWGSEAARLETQSRPRRLRRYLKPPSEELKMFEKSKLALVTAALTLASATAGSAQTPIKIGYINTFSGPIGLLGQDMYDGFMLRIEQNNGKLGGMPVQVIKQDDQFKPEVATQIAEKLIEKDNVPIITGV